MKPSLWIALFLLGMGQLHAEDDLAKKCLHPEEAKQAALDFYEAKGGDHTKREVYGVFHNSDPRSPVYGEKADKFGKQLRKKLVGKDYCIVVLSALKNAPGGMIFIIVTNEKKPKLITIGGYK